MAKKDNAGVDQIVRKVNREFEKTSSQLESMISEALRQIDHLQNQIQEPIRKLLNDVEKMRGREMKRFHDEFERRLHEFHRLQNSILERISSGSESVRQAVGMDSKNKLRKLKADPAGATSPSSKSPSHNQARKQDSSNTAKSRTVADQARAADAKKTAKPKPAAKSRSSAAASSKPAAAESRPSTRTRHAADSKSTGTAKSSSASSATRTARPSKASASRTDGADLTRIKGIGPAIARKMHDKGITRIQQLADPSADDRKALEEFASMKGFDRWRDEAKRLV